MTGNFTFTSDQARAYFESRLNVSLPFREALVTKCPFHPDQTASLSLNTRKGTFKCHAGCGQGGLVDFETKLQGKPGSDAVRAFLSLPRAEKPEAIYEYRDMFGKEVFRKLRYKPDENGRKATRWERKEGERWIVGLEGKDPGIYNLTEVISAQIVLVCEGERKADLLNTQIVAKEGPRPKRVACSTPHGAGPGKWKAEWSRFFAGKVVIVISDNDPVGLAHAEAVAAASYPHAAGVKVVKFTDVPLHFGVDDYLDEKSLEEFLYLVQKNTPRWLPAGDASKREVLIPAIRFAKMADEQVDWLIDGVIQRGANGFFSAAPKSGKSWIALDALISLATGCPWLEFDIPRPVRCGYISREDGANLTAWRLMALFQGKTGGDMALLERNLYINSRRETPQFFLDCEADVQEMVADIKRLDLEFVVLDVFNRIHTADENDTQQMSAIMAQVIKLSNLSGAAIGIVHHYSKAMEGSMSQKLRGSGAIGGFAEWQIGIWVEDEEKHLRGIEFETKAAEPHDKFFFQIQSEKMIRRTEIVRIAHEPIAPTKSRIKRVT